MKHVFMFPGQGSQFPGMGKNLYEQSSLAREYFEQANEILGYRITDVMFSGTEADLKQTNFTQVAIYLHSVVLFETTENLVPDMVAGHSLGEFSALVACKVLNFEDGLRLVAKRAASMQRACELNPSGMAAILGLSDTRVEEICSEVTAETNEVVVAANYNCPGQLVISGSNEGVKIACERLKAAGAKRALPLPVGGAFHSPLMQPARAELSIAIDATPFGNPTCPVYQNVDAKPYVVPEQIKENLMAQLTMPVRWTQTIEKMAEDGATTFTEVGAGSVLQGLVKKIFPAGTTNGIN